MKKFYIFSCLLICAQLLWAQSNEPRKNLDTLGVTLSEIESIFISRNLELISQRYSIDSANATVITARIYENPELEYSHSFYNWYQKKIFEPQLTVQLSQLIQLGSKRKRSIALNQKGVEIARLQFEELLRSLRFQLRTNYYHSHFIIANLKLYETEISSFQKIVTATEEMEKKGFASNKDLVRLKAELFTLTMERDAFQKELNELQSELRFMLQMNDDVFIQPQVGKDLVSLSEISAFSLKSVLDFAFQYRPDLQLLQKQMDYNFQNIELQKSNAVPDIRIIAAYDRLDGYFPNYNSIGFAIPLPLFNRNQGNIKSAQVEWERSKIENLIGVEKVKTEINLHFHQAMQVENSLKNFSSNFENDLKRLMDQVTIGYNNGSISLIEFLDFYNSYKQNTIQLNELRFQKLSSLEQLNYSVGHQLFNKNN